jgi:hypothetical protein
MEIKIQCDCGQKFKFDVEPVNGQMPFVVNCPVCGVDGTPKANALLQQLLPPSPVVAAPAVPAPMRPASMRINRPVAPVANPVEESAEEILEDGEDSDDGNVREFKLGWKVWAIVAVFICIGLLSSFDKWSRRITFVKDIVEFVRGFTSGGEGSNVDAAEVAGQDWTLPDDDGVMMLVKHTNELAVAEACAELLGQQLKSKVSVVKLTTHELDGVDNDSLYIVDPAYNSCVAFAGSMSWEEKEISTLSSLAEGLSKKFNTVAVAALMGDDAEAGTFFVYEGGGQKFRVDRSFRIKDGELLDVVKLEGEAWATGLGFKPGEEGFKGFTMADANALTHHLGLNLTGRPPPSSCIVLQRAGGKP